MQIERLKLKKTKNMRDMGGIPTADGRKIKTGKIIRSGRMCNLPPGTVRALVDMGVDNIIDLRSDREVAAKPPTRLDGVTYRNIPLVATCQPYLSKSKHMSSEMYAQSKRVKRDFGTSDNYMREMYKHLVFDPDSQKKIKEVLDLIIAEENTIIFHCNSGTDRTGIIAMLLESALGVEKDMILQDYMASRRFQLRRRTLQRIALVPAPVHLCLKKLLFAQMLPKPQYMSGLINEIESKYGSVVNYLKEALGVTDDDIKTLKDKYLE